jgi:hypothetical protein
MMSEEIGNQHALQRKTCFVIAPIGEEGTDTRRSIDGLLEAVIRPILSSEYNVEVSHQLDRPGWIAGQIIERLIQHDLIIADLTSLNPNVMYELAVRHCQGKPVVVIALNGTKLPFDIAPERTVFYANDIAGSVKLRDDLSRAIEAAMSGGEFDNPVLRTTKSIAVRESLPQAKDDYIVEQLDQLRSMLASVVSNERQIHNARQMDIILGRDVDSPRAVDMPRGPHFQVGNVSTVSPTTYPPGQGPSSFEKTAGRVLRE